MTTMEYSKKVKISNFYAQHVIGLYIGKDERVLMYEWCRLFLPYIQFFYVFFARGVTLEQKQTEIVFVKDVNVYNIFPWNWYNPKYPILALKELFIRTRLERTFGHIVPDIKGASHLTSLSEHDKIREGLLDYRPYLDKREYTADPRLQSEEPIHFRFSDYMKSILEVMLQDYVGFRRNYNEDEKKLALARLLDPAVTEATLDTYFIPRPIPRVKNMMNRELPAGGVGDAGGVGEVGRAGEATGGAGGATGGAQRGGRRKTRRLRKKSKKSKKQTKISVRSRRL